MEEYENTIDSMLETLNPQQLIPLYKRESIYVQNKDINKQGLYDEEWWQFPDYETTQKRIKLMFYTPQECKVENKRRIYIGRKKGKDGNEILGIGRITLAWYNGSFGGVGYFICETKPNENVYRIVYKNYKDNCEYVLREFPLDVKDFENYYPPIRECLKENIRNLVNMWGLKKR